MQRYFEEVGLTIPHQNATVGMFSGTAVWDVDCASEPYVSEITTDDGVVMQAGKGGLIEQAVFHALSKTLDGMFADDVSSWLASVSRRDLGYGHSQREFV